MKQPIKLLIAFAIGLVVAGAALAFGHIQDNLYRLLALLPLASAWIFGFRAIFQPGFIFGELGDKLSAKLPDWLFMPVIQCPPCMASVHGSIIFWIAIHNVWLWLPFVVCLAGVNYVVAKLIEGNE